MRRGDGGEGGEVRGVLGAGGRNDFKFGAFIGRFLQSDGAETMAVKGLINNQHISVFTFVPHLHLRKLLPDTFRQI